MVVNEQSGRFQTVFELYTVTHSLTHKNELRNPPHPYPDMLPSLLLLPLRLVGAIDYAMVRTERAYTKKKKFTRLCRGVRFGVCAMKSVWKYSAYIFLWWETGFTRFVWEAATETPTARHDRLLAPRRKFWHSKPRQATLQRTIRPMLPGMRPGSVPIFWRTQVSKTSNRPTPPAMFWYPPSTIHPSTHPPSTTHVLRERLAQTNMDDRHGMKRWTARTLGHFE